MNLKIIIIEIRKNRYISIYYKISGINLLLRKWLK